MEDGFDVVSVRIEHVGRVIAGVIFALAWRSVVAAACGKSSFVEAADRLVVRGLKGDVKPCSRVAVVAHEELVRGEGSIALPREVSPDRSQDRAVEALARFEIGNAYVNVVKEPTQVEFIHAALSFSRHSGVATASTRDHTSCAEASRPQAFTPARRCSSTSGGERSPRRT